MAASYVPGEALVVFRKAPGDGVTAASVERGLESFRLAALAAASGARVAQAYASSTACMALEAMGPIPRVRAS